MNIFRQVSSSSSDGGIFRNEDALMPNYLPDSVMHRQREVGEIAYALRNIPKGRKPENVLLTGPSGTGKTTCSRHVLRELSDYTQRAVPIYVNCWEYSTRFSILNLVVTKLGEILPRRGIAVDEIIDRISQICRLENKIPVLVLDEIDRLLVSAHGEERLLYDIARSGENFGVNFGLIGITNNESFQSMLDPRVKSSLSFVHMKFDKYSPMQLKDILNARSQVAFAPGIVEPEVIPVCAAMGAKYGGDARVSITALWKAGRRAEKRGSARVAIEDARAVAPEVLEELRKQDFALLSDIEKEIVSIVKSSGGKIESGPLYAKLAKKGIEDRNARNYISRLIAAGFLKAEDVQKKLGRTREISLA